MTDSDDSDRKECVHPHCGTECAYESERSFNTAESGDSGADNPIMGALERKEQCNDCQELLAELEQLADEWESDARGSGYGDRAQRNCAAQLRAIIDEYGASDE